jgi:eukaryotic-like serine/threonine-protein kinase
VKLTDFSLAQSISPSNLPQFNQPTGTPAYMPPEQASCSPLSFSADIYSIGVIFYELLLGHRPPARGITDEDTKAISLLTERTGNSALAKLVLSCLSPDPQRRPKSTREFVKELDR